MNVYKVFFERFYPGADEDFQEAFVLANSFQEAQIKVERNITKEYESAKVCKIELLDRAIILV